MTAASECMTLQSRPRFSVIFLLLVVTFLLAVMFSISHVIERHGVDGLNAYNCSIGSDNLIQKWTKPDGRQMYVCQVGDNFGIVVEDAEGELVTAFIKDRMKRIDQVVRYMLNNKATQVW